MRMAIGNDIVDLEDDESRDALGNSAFILRVFTQEEQRAIKAAANPLSHLWATWACKESAYKAMKQLHPFIGFSPRKFKVAGDLSAVHFAGYRLHCRVETTPQYVMALATTQDTLNAVHSACVLLPAAASRQTASDAARSLLKRLASDATRIGVEALQVSAPDAYRPPVLKSACGSFWTSVSISHHGRFTAAAFSNGKNPH